MRIYALADLHLSTTTEKPMDVFGSRWKNHTDRIKKNWEKLISDEDIVIISGDVSWGLKLDEAIPDLEWIHRLPGRKIISKGNHDLWWTSLTKLNALFDDITFVQNGCITAGDTVICGTRGWNLPQTTPNWTDHDEKIYRREQLRLEMSLKEAVKTGCSRRILSIHYPPLNRLEMQNGFTELIEKYRVDTVIYGHLHGEDAGKNAFSGSYNGTEYRLAASDQIRFMPLFICEAGEKEHE